MNKKGISNFIKTVGNKLSEHSPEILTGIGITGLLSTTVLAVKATPKALRLIDEKKEEYDTDELTNMEVIKTCWKCYIPAAVTASVSVACIIGANSVNSKRNAVLATAYKLSESAFSEYKEKLLKLLEKRKKKKYEIK